MKKIIGYRLFALLYRIGSWFFKLDNNSFFCVMTHDGSDESSVGVVINAIRKRNPDADFVCIKKENKTKMSFVDFMLVKPFQMAKAATILMDNEFLPLAYINLRRNVKVVQLWHGTGTIKKFGHDVNEGALLDTLTKADKKITHLIVNSEYTKKLYAHIFGVSPEKIYLTGIPRTDMLFNESEFGIMKSGFYQSFPELEGKKLVLYAPTFRDNQVDNPEIMIDFEKWIDNVDEDTVLMLRLHPFVAKQFSGKHDGRFGNRIVDMSSYPNLNTLLSVSDVLITDYSSIIFEYIVFNRPIVFFAYDLETFEKDGRGFYEDYTGYVPGEVVSDTEGIINVINRPDEYADKRKRFYDDAYEYKDGNSTERLLKLIL